MKGKIRRTIKDRGRRVDLRGEFFSRRKTNKKKKNKFLNALCQSLFVTKERLPSWYKKVASQRSFFFKTRFQGRWMKFLAKTKKKKEFTEENLLSSHTLPGEGVIQRLKLLWVVPKWILLGWPFSSFLFPIFLFKAGFNLIKDSDFEQPKPKTTWEEKERGSRENAKADSYFLGGYKSERCGYTRMWSADGDVGYAKLKQELSKRIIDELGEISWYVKFWYDPADMGFNYFGIDLITTKKDTLTYVYKGVGTPRVPLPEETGKRKIIELHEREITEWWFEKRNLKMDWIEEFGSERLQDSLAIIELMAYGAEGSGISGEKVRWDNVNLLSERFDHDYATLSIDSEKPQVGEVYFPLASFANVGAFDNTSKVVFNIFGKETLFYSDTLEAKLGIDEQKKFSFKEWQASSDRVKLEAKVLFEEDQNPKNDVVVKDYTSLAEDSPSRQMQNIQVWPLLSRGTIHYDLNEDKARIYDSSGRLVEELEGKGKIKLGKGIYFLKGRETKKIVVF